MNDTALRQQALEVARTTPGNLLENAENIYQWLVNRPPVPEAVEERGIESTVAQVTSPVVSNVGTPAPNGLVKGVSLAR